MFNNLKIRLLNTCVLRVFGAKSRFSFMDEDKTGCNWRGVPISEIIGSQSPWGAPEFPLISPGHSHTVLYHIPSNGDLGDRPPKPQVGQEKWDSEHVRMPCSSKSLYPVEDSNGESHLRKRWEMIEEALRKPILNSEQLAAAILSYNTKFRTKWKFRALHALFNDHLDEEVCGYFFSVTLPQIARLALDLPKLIQAPIPLLKQHKNHSISLTQLQTASLLANAFFCTFPRRNANKHTSEYASYPHINFSALYECEPQDDVLEKLTCFCHYFRRVCTKPPRGVVTFCRRSVPPRSCPHWSSSGQRLSTLPVHVDPDGRIEDAHGLIQLDFANKYVGGGVLGRGSVQEEIRFAICPELMVSMLFTEVLRPNEALLIIGCERYSQYTGYGRTFRWAGPFEDTTPFDSAGRRRVAVLAVDAMPYARAKAEYRPEMITRELNKAWVGFSFFTEQTSTTHYPGIATGNWGCGAFGGSPELKSLIQLMASAQARRPMAYFTFGDTHIRDQLVNVYNLLARHDVTVGPSTLQYPGIATGNWGCGALGGSPELKSLNQLMASAQARRPMAYFTFGDTHIRDQLVNVYNLLARHDVTVGQLYQYLCQFSASDVKVQHLHAFIQQLILDEAKRPNSGSTRPGRPSNQSDSPKVQDRAKDRTTEAMDTTSAQTEQQNDNAIQKELKNNSPDLFSQDDEQKQDFQATQIVNLLNETSNENKMAATSHKMAPQTKRLFDELEKFDEDNGKLNLKTDSKTSKYFDMPELSQDILSSSDSDLNEIVINPSKNQDKTVEENKMAAGTKMADESNMEEGSKLADGSMVVNGSKGLGENMADGTKMEDASKMAGGTKMEDGSKMAEGSKLASGNKMAVGTSRLFEELQKLDEQQGKLNLSASHSSLLDDSLSVSSSDVPMDCDRSEVSPEVKKKIARKITDYFTKKS